MRHIALAFLFLASVSFAWWDPSFQYMRQVNMTSSSALADYQVQVDPQIYNSTGLVGSWHFSEGSGARAADSSGSNNGGTLNNGPAWTTGKFGSGLQFDGVDDNVDAGNAAGLDSAFDGGYTVEMWVKTASAESLKGLFEKRDAATGTMMVFFNYPSVGKVKFYSGSNVDSNALDSMASDLNNGLWRHLVFQLDGTTQKIYVDGALDNSRTKVSGTSSDGTFRIGRLSTTYFNGVIDEVRVYNRSLSATEVQEHYNAQKARLDYADLRFTQPYTVYETPVPISGAISNLTDYQVLINIANSTILSHMRSDGADLRFFSSATSTPYSSSGLSYWIENINSTQARVWVKANVSSGGSTLYLYYGNVSAQAQSNGSAVFLFFDDFNDNNISDYTQAGSQYTVSGGMVTSTSGYDSLLRPFTYPQYPFIAEVDIKPVAGADNPHWLMLTTGTSEIYGGFSGYSSEYLIWNDDPHYTGSGSSIASAWRRLGLMVSSSKIELYDSYKGASAVYSWTAPPIMIPFKIGIYEQTSAGGLWDNLRVRKYASSEPSASVGSETIQSSGFEASLPFWLESDKSAWVKVPSLPSGIGTIYSYYGSPSAVSAANGTNTFMAFNDFNADYGYTMIDTGSSETFGSSAGEIRTNANKLDYVGFSNAKNSYMYKDYGAGYFTGDWVLEHEVLVATATYTGSAIGVTLTDDTNGIDSNNNADGYFFQDVPHVQLYHSQSATKTYSAGLGFTKDTKYYSRMVRAGAALTLYLYSDPTRTTQISGSPKTLATNAQGLRYLMAADRYSTLPSGRAMTGYIDNIIVRKYVSPEPSVSSGAEQQSDVISPSVSIQSPNASVTYTSLSVPLNFTATDASGISSCKYELNGVNTTLAGCQNTTMTASSGSNSLKVWAYDGINWGSASVSFDVQLDTTPPIISISSPANSSYPSASVPVSFVVSDNVAVSSCIVALNGTLNSSSCANYSLSLGNGAYTLNISANDTSGNVNSSAVSFTVSIPVSVSNSTTTNSNGIGNVSLSGIPPGASTIVYSVGSPSQPKPFSFSSGVSSVRVSARVTLQGTPVSGRTLGFVVS